MNREQATMIAVKLARKVWEVLLRDFPQAARKMEEDCNELTTRGFHVFPGTGLQTVYIGNTPAFIHRDDKNQDLTAAIWFQTREIEGKILGARMDARARAHARSKR